MYAIVVATLAEAFGTMATLVFICLYITHLFALFGQE